MRRAPKMDTIMLDGLPWCFEPFDGGWRAEGGAVGEWFKIPGSKATAIALVRKFSAWDARQNSKRWDARHGGAALRPSCPAEGKRSDPEHGGSNR